MARPKRKSSGAATGKKKGRQPDYGLLWLPVVLFFVMLSGLTVFYVWEHIRLREINRDIVQLQKARSEVIGENELLRARAEELSSYRRIYGIATKYFGFVELKPRVVVQGGKKRK